MIMRDVSLLFINPGGTRIDGFDHEKFDEYIRTSDHYLINAKKMDKKGDVRKASELLWGSIALLIKAIGLLYDKPVDSHKELLDMARSVAFFEKDSRLEREFFEYIRPLHVNYYENLIDPRDFDRYKDAFNHVHDKLLRIIKREFNRRSRTSVG